MEPCLERSVFAECRQLPPRGDERLLDGVLGAPDVTQDPMRDGEQPVSRAASDGGEGLLVPGPRRLDEGEVYPSGSPVRGPWLGRFIHYERRSWPWGVKIVTAPEIWTSPRSPVLPQFDPFAIFPDMAARVAEAGSPDAPGAVHRAVEDLHSPRPE